MKYGNTLYDLEDTKVNNNLEIYNYHYDKESEYTKEEYELFIISKDINKKIKNKYQVFDKETNKIGYWDITKEQRTGPEGICEDPYSDYDVIFSAHIDEKPIYTEILERRYGTEPPQ